MQTTRTLPTCIATRMLVLGALIGSLVGSLGCGSQGPVHSFEHLELLPPEIELLEFSLGQYAVPIPTDMSNRKNVERRNRLQLEFTLIAEIEPGNANSVGSDYKAAENQIRDSVIRACREATLNDLEEPNLLTLKTDLLDAVDPFFGSDRIRRLVVTDLQKYEL